MTFWSGAFAITKFPIGKPALSCHSYKSCFYHHLMNWSEFILKRKGFVNVNFFTITTKLQWRAFQKEWAAKTISGWKEMFTVALRSVTWWERRKIIIGQRAGGTDTSSSPSPPEGRTGSQWLSPRASAISMAFSLMICKFSNKEKLSPIDNGQASEQPAKSSP